MSHQSFQTQTCSECGEPLSLEVGIVNYGPEGASRLYCQPCSPNKGKGYTPTDLQQMRAEGQAARAAYEMSLMDKVGPDVYFAVKDDPEVGNQPKEQR